MEQKTELKWRIATLIIVILLCVAIYINGKSLDCEKCAITFKSSRPKSEATSNEEIQEISIKIKEFHKSLEEDRCILTWDKWQGFIYFEEWKQPN